MSQAAVDQFAEARHDSGVSEARQISGIDRPFETFLRNRPHFAKLETECADIIATLTKYFLLAISRFTSELENGATSDSATFVGMLRLFNV